MYDTWNFIIALLLSARSSCVMFISACLCIAFMPMPHLNRCVSPQKFIQRNIVTVHQRYVIVDFYCGNGRYLFSKILWNVVFDCLLYLPKAIKIKHQIIDWPCWLIGAQEFEKMRNYYIYVTWSRGMSRISAMLFLRCWQKRYSNSFVLYCF